MKSLLEVQQDIRKLESSINDITDSIRNINSDIEELRTVNQNTYIDYSIIELLAKQLSFGKHPLDKLDDGRVRQVYLKMLLNIVRLDFEEEISLNRLIFIQWIQKESRIDWSLEDLFKDCYKIKADSYHEMIDVIPKKYRECFIVDTLIVANLGGPANTEIYEYIAGLVAILGVDKERLKTLSMRQIVVQLSDDEAKNFKWKVKQGQAVKKDDVIATYSRATRKRGYAFSTNYVTEEIKAPIVGTIF